MSVWHFLVAIALLPTLALPTLAATVARDRLGQAQAESRLERDLLAVAATDQVRESLTIEAAARTLTLLAGEVGMPAAVIGGQLGLRQTSVADAEAATDKALAAGPRVAAFSAMVARIRADLPPLRASLSRFKASPGQGLTGMATAMTSYRQLTDMVTDAEHALARLVGNRPTTATSADLQASSRSFSAIFAVITSQVRRANLFYSGLLSGSPSRSERDELAWESKRYEVLSAQLDTELDRQTARAWREISSDEQFRTFNAAVAKGLATTPSIAATARGGSLDLSTILSVLPAARAAWHTVDRLSGFLRQVAQETAAVARSEAAAGRRRAAMSVGGTVLVIGVTVLALFVIGGLLKRRLNLLAQGAQRLSDGHLEPVSVRGPRELAATSEALNAAVTSLHHVQAKAELLAAGDLTSPELEKPAPGPLGAAVHASVSRIVTAVRDREQLQLQLAHQASHDTLTGLPNRAELDRALTGALGRAQRSATPVSVLFVDLDGFKACNDRFGHAAGDHILRVTAQRLHEAVRPGDVVARLGGDEFIVIVEGAPPGPDTVAIGERIVATLSQPIDHDGHRITIGASVGLAGCDHGQASADQLLLEADSAVYHAKASGRGRVQVQDQNLRAALHAQQSLETAVRRALEHDEFVLHYQPVVDLTTLRLCGLEALIRWQKPGTGLVMPGEFLPAIETTDLILDVDRWVLDAATTQLLHWSSDPALNQLTMWVNISGRHLANGDVVEDVRGALTRSGLQSAQLGIEITEGVSIDNPQSVEHLRQLTALGVRLALDDFGTGHTSINQLLNLPINVLKLDRSLINTLHGAEPTVPGSPSVSRHVIDMAHTLGLTIVAEGIEHPGQLAALQASHCDRGQGYLISRPLEPHQVPTWSASRPWPTDAQAGQPN